MSFGHLYSPEVESFSFVFFKTKLAFMQTVDEIKKNVMRQLIAITKEDLADCFKK